MYTMLIFSLGIGGGFSSAIATACFAASFVGCGLPPTLWEYFRLSYKTQALLGLFAAVIFVSLAVVCDSAYLFGVLWMLAGIAAGITWICPFDRLYTMFAHDKVVNRLLLHRQSKCPYTYGFTILNAIVTCYGDVRLLRI